MLTVTGLAKVGPGPRRVHRPDLSGLSLADVVSLWHLADEPAAPVANGGGESYALAKESPSPTQRAVSTRSFCNPAASSTPRRAVRHDDLIGGPQGVVVTSVGGLDFLAMRPILSEFTVSMPREAAIIYPKEAAQITMWADIFPGHEY